VKDSCAVPRYAFLDVLKRANEAWRVVYPVASAIGALVGGNSNAENIPRGTHANEQTISKHGPKAAELW
jgi:hypothetical protein